MLVPFKKIPSNSYICGKSGCQECKYEKRWNKRNNKPYLERARIKRYEEKIIKEELNSILDLTF